MPIASALPGSPSGDVLSLAQRANTNTRFGDAAARAVSPETVEQDPLHDLRLPPELFEVFQQSLAELGFQVEQPTLEDQYSYVQRRVTLIRNGISRVVLYLPTEILDKALPAYLAAVTSLPGILTEGAAVVILAKDLDAPADVYSNIFTSLWAERLHIEVIWVPWRYIREFQATMPLPSARLARWLKLHATVTAAPLSQADRDAIVVMVAEVAAVKPGGSQEYMPDLARRTPLLAYWKRELSGNWNGDAQRDAGWLVDWALSKGRNPAELEHTVLASLLGQVRNDVGAQLYPLIDRIIAQHTYR